MSQEMNMIFSDLVKGEVASGDLAYNTAVETVTFAAGMRLGTALKVVGGKYVAATDSDDAAIESFLVDPDTIPQNLIAFPIADGDQSLVVGKNGFSLVGKYVVYADGTPVSAAGLEALATATRSKIY